MPLANELRKQRRVHTYTRGLQHRQRIRKQSRIDTPHTLGIEHGGLHQQPVFYLVESVGDFRPALRPLIHSHGRAYRYSPR